MSLSMLKGLHRRALGIGYRDEIMAPNGYFTGGENTPGFFLPSHNTVALFDDFLGDLIADEWAAVEGDTGYTQAIVTGTNGVFEILSSNTGALAPTSASAITGGLMKQWKLNSGGAKNGRLRMTARVKLENVTRTADRIHAFIGFSDSGGAEMPAFDTGAGIISNAADLVGFLFSPGGDTGWSCISVKSTAGDSGDQLVVAGSSFAPVANTYQTLEVEVRTGQSDTGGRAHFWIDGKKVNGTIDSPVGSAIALTPWVGMWCQDTGDQFLHIDYVAVSAPRDTGL